MPVEVIVPDEIYFKAKKEEGRCVVEYVEKYPSNVQRIVLENTKRLVEFVSKQFKESVDVEISDDNTVSMVIELDDNNCGAIYDILVSELITRTTIGELTLNQILVLALLGGALIRANRIGSVGKKD